MLAKNALIERLPRKDRARLLSIAEAVPLALTDVFSEVGKPARYVYFPVEGFISLITSIDGKPVLEVGMIGREGMFGAQASLEVLTQPLHALVQGAGSAWRMTMQEFRQELKSVAVQHTLNRYIYVLMGQLASSAGCVRFHQIGPRLARWLLMTQDRADASGFVVTHEMLGFMLGVRRVGITMAAGELQEKGLIEYRRGQVTVLDRIGLEAESCSCYASDRETYRRVMN